MKKKLFLFFLSLCLGAGLGYAVIALTGESVRKSGGLSSVPGFRNAFRTNSGIRVPSDDPLPLSRERERKRAFQAAFIGDPIKDWKTFLNRDPLLEESEAMSLLVEHWGRHCPRQALRFLFSAEFMEKDNLQAILCDDILTEWRKNQPAQVCEYCEGILSNPSSCSRAEIKRALSQLPASLSSKSAEDNLKWALSLEGNEEGGVREKVLKRLLGRAKESGKSLDEWCAAVQKIAPESEQKEWGRRLLFSGLGVEDQEGFRRWAETFSLDEGDHQLLGRGLNQIKWDKQAEEEKVKFQARFEQEGDYSSILSDIKEEQTEKAYEEWNSRNEESFRQYVLSLPEGEGRKHALTYLAQNAANMEYQDRLALFSQGYRETMGDTFALNNLLLDISFNDNSGREVKALLDSAAFLSDREKESYQTLQESVQAAAPQSLNKRSGAGARFYRKADNPFRSYSVVVDKDGIFRRKEHEIPPWK